MYRLQVLERAEQDLASLDKEVARRIVKKLKWLAENIESVRREPLTGSLSDFLKYRIGDYRAIYQVLEDERILVIYEIGHRREVYKDR
ncbi:MAG: addiction module antitoxin [Chloroflexi bacterium RIFOXYC12_FULL_59_14]|nr:MAG: addiction module antitoxin [Chloroflexi bacterium RIFOXYC12_FULL_59_14]